MGVVKVLPRRVIAAIVSALAVPALILRIATSSRGSRAAVTNVAVFEDTAACGLGSESADLLGVDGITVLATTLPSSSNTECVRGAVDLKISGRYPRSTPRDCCCNGALVVKDLTLDDAEMGDMDDPADGGVVCITVVVAAVGVRGNVTAAFIERLKLVPKFWLI